MWARGVRQSPLFPATPWQWCPKGSHLSIPSSRPLTTAAPLSNDPISDIPPDHVVQQRPAHLTERRVWSSAHIGIGSNLGESRSFSSARFLPSTPFLLLLFPHQQETASVIFTEPSVW